MVFERTRRNKMTGLTKSMEKRRQRWPAKKWCSRRPLKETRTDCRTARNFAKLSFFKIRFPHMNDDQEMSLLAVRIVTCCGMFLLVQRTDTCMTSQLLEVALPKTSRSMAESAGDSDSCSEWQVVRNSKKEKTRLQFKVENNAQTFCLLRLTTALLLARFLFLFLLFLLCLLL